MNYLRQHHSIHIRKNLDKLKTSNSLLSNWFVCLFCECVLSQCLIQPGLASNSLCSWRQPWTPDLSTSASWVMGLQAWATTLGINLMSIKNWCDLWGTTWCFSICLHCITFKAGHNLSPELLALLWWNTQFFIFFNVLYFMHRSVLSAVYHMCAQRTKDGIGSLGIGVKDLGVSI